MVVGTSVVAKQQDHAKTQAKSESTLRWEGRFSSFGKQGIILDSYSFGWGSLTPIVKYEH